MSIIRLWDITRINFDKTYHKYLGIQEKKKINRLKTRLRKTQYLSGRILLKSILIREYYKPKSIFLVDLPKSNYEEIYFSLSHSKFLIMAGFSKHNPIGVDLEIRRRTEITRVVHRFFSVSEINTFTNLAIDEQIDYFYKIWTIKEAYYKYLFNSGLKYENINFFKTLKYSLDQIFSSCNSFSGKGFKLIETDLEYYWSLVSKKTLKDTSFNVSNKLIFKPIIKFFHFS